MLFPSRTCTNVPLFLTFFYFLLNNVHSHAQTQTYCLTHKLSAYKGSISYPHLYFPYPHYLMGVDISCYRARVGLFFASYKPKNRLSLLEIICINNLLSQGKYAVLLALSLYTFYKFSHSGIGNVHSLYFLNSHANTHINTNELLSTNIPLFILFLIAVLLLLLSGYIELNPGPTHYQSDCSIESSQNYPDTILSSKGISFVHLNVQSLLPKLDILESELGNHSILSFTETWLSQEVPNSDLYISNFQSPFCYCRPDKSGVV